jgi:pyruvate formate lyase activating enzyme
MKVETAFYEKLENGMVKCKICSHYCLIKPGNRGFCSTRINEDGTLYSLIYGGMISKGSVDPIEKKPLYHFLPRAKAYSIASVGCSMKCEHCQNWDISRANVNSSGKVASVNEPISDVFGRSSGSFILTEMKPEQIAELIIRSKCETLAYTYNEPTIWFEFIRDLTAIIKPKGVKSILVTNGYSSMETNQEYVKFIDAANIDLKAFSQSFYREVCKVPDFNHVLNTIKFFHENGVHIELTNLIIPNKNDSLEELAQMCEWIVENVGEYVPLHFSAYHPSYKMKEPRTTVDILMKAYDIAQSKGIKYIFLGNVMAEKGSDSICPNCKSVLVKRSGYYTEIGTLNKEGKCAKCDFDTKIIMK